MLEGFECIIMVDEVRAIMPGGRVCFLDTTCASADEFVKFAKEATDLLVYDVRNK